LTGFNGSEEIGGADVRVCAGVHILAYVCNRVHRGQERRRERASERASERARERERERDSALLQSKVTPCNCCCLIANSKSSRYRTRSAQRVIALFKFTYLLFSGTIATGAGVVYRIFRIRHTLSPARARARARFNCARISSAGHATRLLQQIHNGRAERTCLNSLVRDSFACCRRPTALADPRASPPPARPPRRVALSEDLTKYPPPFGFAFNPDARGASNAPAPAPAPAGQFCHEPRDRQHCQRQTMPHDKNVKLMLFCSHCLRRCATFAARLAEPLAIGPRLHPPPPASLSRPLVLLPPAPPRDAILRWSTPLPITSPSPAVCLSALLDAVSPNTSHLAP